MDFQQLNFVLMRTMTLRCLNNFQCRWIGWCNLYVSINRKGEHEPHHNNINTYDKYDDNNLAINLWMILFKIHKSIVHWHLFTVIFCRILSKPDTVIICVAIWSTDIAFGLTWMAGTIFKYVDAVMPFFNLASSSKFNSRSCTASTSSLMDVPNVISHAWAPIDLSNIECTLNCANIFVLMLWCSPPITFNAQVNICSECRMTTFVHLVMLRAIWRDTLNGKREYFGLNQSMNDNIDNRLEFNWKYV